MRGQIREIATRRVEIEQARAEFRQRSYDYPGTQFGNETTINDVLGGILQGAMKGIVLGQVLQQGYQRPPASNWGGGGMFPGRCTHPQVIFLAPRWVLPAETVFVPAVRFRILESSSISRHAPQKFRSSSIKRSLASILRQPPDEATCAPRPKRLIGYSLRRAPAV
jgi:hypothetical protein